MSIDAISGLSNPTTTAASTAALTGPANQLGQDAFLKLLVTQLQHQDPTKPMADGEFITQLATFSSLEKLTQIADSTSALQGLFQAVQNATTK